MQFVDGRKAADHGRLEHGSPGNPHLGGTFVGADLADAGTQSAADEGIDFPPATPLVEVFHGDEDSPECEIGIEGH